jgi:uncharacterized protein YacL
MTKIQHIGVLSVAKVAAIIYLVIGLIIGLLSSVAVLVASVAASGDFPIANGMFFAIMTLVLAPLFYAVLGFVLGAIAAAVYNVAAKAIGGVEVDLVTPEPGTGIMDAVVAADASE